MVPPPRFKITTLPVWTDLSFLEVTKLKYWCRTHRDTTQVKAAATNYVLIPEPLGRCDGFLRLRFEVRRKPTNLSEISLVSLKFPHGKQIRSRVDEERQGGAAIVSRDFSQTAKS